MTMKMIHQRFQEFCREYGDELWLFSLGGIARKIGSKSITDVSAYFTKAYGMNFRKLAGKENWQSYFRPENLIDRRAETNRRRTGKRNNRILLLLQEFAARNSLADKSMSAVAQKIGVNYFTLHTFLKRNLQCGWKELRQHPNKYLGIIFPAPAKIETVKPAIKSIGRPVNDPEKYPACKDCGFHRKGRYVGKSQKWQCIYCGEIPECAKLKYNRNGIPGDADIDLAKHTNR